MRLVALMLLMVAGGLAWLLPPKARAVEDGPTARAVRGAVHVHTSRSDGTGTVDDVARAAALAGLSFVVITDHGDGARAPEAPSYRHGVLCIDSVEVSTD